MMRRRMSKLKRAIVALKWKVARSRKPAPTPFLSDLGKYTADYIVPLIWDQVYAESPVLTRLTNRGDV